jgi:hypothetical protein
MNPNEANALFTATSLLSLQGSAVASLFVPNVLMRLIGDRFRPYAKWVSFAIAMFLSFSIAFMASSQEMTKWVVAFFNGFMICASAIGFNEAASGGTQLRGPGKKFFRSWL